MDLKIDKARIGKLTIGFFTGMLLFTLLSRAAYQHGTAVVTVAAPTRGSISHAVQLTGSVVQNQELAVTTVGGLLVSGIPVNEGQQVSQGDVLLSLDLDYLNETIEKQQQEMQKQRMSIQDAWSQIAASQKQRANAQAQAEENYDSAVSQGQTALDRATWELEQAEEALEAYYNGSMVDPAVEESLVADYQAATNAYNTACAAAELLEQELSDAIQEEIALAEEEILNTPDAPPLSQEDREAIAQKVQMEYAQQISDAQRSVDQAQSDMEQAQADLQDYYLALQANDGLPSEQELLAAVEQAQEAYDEALTALENTKTVYGRAIHTAKLPDSTNHSAQIGQITYAQMESFLKKLEALRDAGGEILSPVDGIVTRCNVQTGEKTTDTAAMLLADLSQGCKFTGFVTQEQRKYIGVGDRVTLTASATGKTYRDLPVTTLSASEEGEDTYRLTVQLPANTLSVGANAQLSFTQKSQPYTCCIPLTALRLDERNQPYVLVVEPVDTVLGTQMQARKVSVTVLEQNEHMAALEPGSLSTQQQVITQADRAIAGGSRVRVE